MSKRIIVWAVALLAAVCLLAGCTPPADSPAPAAAPVPTAALTQAPQTTLPDALPDTLPDTPASSAPPKYIFLFIGDGMSFAQIHAAQVFRGSNASGGVDIRPLNFTQFPVAGVVTTHNASAVIPDSASTGTAIACGVKTNNGMLGQTADGTTAANIAELLAASGKRIGIVSSVTLNNATPAAFYAHAGSRTDYDDITKQMAGSEVDYFAGGAIYSASEKDTIAKDYSLFEQQGYTLATTREEIQALGSGSGKVYALSPVIAKQGALPFAIDAQEGDLTLADFVSKGIDVLDNPSGFFMMCESGKIDWACHAHDASTAIAEMLAFESAIQQAIDFASAHPEQTLILVTADHETGGMSVGNAAMAYSTNLDMLGRQKVSYSVFKTMLSDMIGQDPNLELSGVMPVIEKYFGLYSKSSAHKADSADFVLSDDEYGQIKDAFLKSKSTGSQASDESTALLYGSYDPLTITLTHILSSKAGIGWTSYAHTGLPVPVYAMGAGADQFCGAYDNTQIFDKLVGVCALSDQIPQ